MKKLMAVILIVLLVLGEAASFASVPSKTATDNTQVLLTESVSGATVDERFHIKVIPDAEPVINDISDLYVFVNEQQRSPVHYFSEETVASIKAVLAAQTGEPVTDETLQAMLLNEFVSIRPVQYKEEYGDIKAFFAFVTQYRMQQRVVVLLGIYVDEANVDWTALEAEVQADGSLAVVIPQAEMLRILNAETAALAVLSDPLVQ